MTELLLFLAAAGLGALLRILYFFLSLLAGSTRLKAMFYIFDVLWCAAAFAGFLALVVFLGGGKFEAFMLLGMAAGLAAGSVFFAAVKRPKPPPGNQ